MEKTFLYFVGFRVTKEMQGQLYQMLGETDMSLAEFMRQLVREKWDKTIKEKYEKHSAVMWKQ